MKRHLTVANVLSGMALFVALSGVAYAAKTLGKNQVKANNIAKEAVTNPKIKIQAVTSGKIKNGGVNATDIAPGAVINSKIANEAVGASKLAKKAVTVEKIGPEAVTTGKLDNEAVTGGKLATSLWSQLLKNVTYVTETSVNDSEAEKSVTATCPAGKEVIGGGARINSPSSVAVAVSASYPLTTATNTRVGWIASGHEAPTEPGNWQVVAYAICAEL